MRICLALLCGLAGLLLLAAALNHLALCARIPQVERLRRDAAGCTRPSVDAERANAMIESWRRANRQWGIGWMVPDGWDDVPLIRCSRREPLAEGEQYNL